MLPPDGFALEVIFWNQIAEFRVASAKEQVFVDFENIGHSRSTWKCFLLVKEAVLIRRVQGLAGDVALE